MPEVGVGGATNTRLVVGIDDEDADEETSSRESSRRPSKQDIETSTSSPVKKRQKKENAGDMKKKKDFESKSSLNQTWQIVSESEQMCLAKKSHWCFVSFVCTTCVLVRSFVAVADFRIVSGCR